MQRIPILRHQVMRFQQRRADPHPRTLQPCRILAHPTPSYDSFPKYRKPARIRFAYTTDNTSMQRITGIITWIIQATWYTNTPNPTPLTEAIWLIMVIGGAGLIFGPRIKQP